MFLSCLSESFTADHKPLMGEAPEVRGYFLGCGFNSAGMMLGGGCGRELAHWIIHGRPEKDMYGYDISHESYAKNYSVVFPFDEPLASRNMRRDPFHQVKDYDYYGAYETPKNVSYKYNDLLGKEYTFDFPPHHDVIKNECLTCRNGVAVFNMSYFGKFYLTGPDAKKAADWLFTADVNKKPGSTVYTCMLNKRGGSEADLTVSRLQPGAANLPLAPESDGDAYYLAIGGGVAEHNWNHIRTVLQDQGFRCQLTDHSEDMGMISIQGPKSRAVLQEVLDTDLSNEAFPFSSHKVVSAAGHQSIESAHVWSGGHLRNGVPVGHLRRSDYGFFIDKTIGYGYIRNPDGVNADFIKSGEFTLERMGVTYKAKAHIKTPFDPENKRVKGIYD
ncbi:hypothetical protein WMY93_021571 [Mugilogobius chulae]|uniref:Sarcosine dehydrogenase n=1 Tax=Mugilogobius chulae TaxID=88201 RepID=A0AAW0NNI2_9GOBI